jgi:hypothetical protein
MSVVNGTLHFVDGSSKPLNTLLRIPGMKGAYRATAKASKSTTNPILVNGEPRRVQHRYTFIVRDNLADVDPVTLFQGVDFTGAVKGSAGARSHRSLAVRTIDGAKRGVPGGIATLIGAKDSGLWVADAQVAVLVADVPKRWNEAQFLKAQAEIGTSPEDAAEACALWAMGRDSRSYEQRMVTVDSCARLA